MAKQYQKNGNGGGQQTESKSRAIVLLNDGGKDTQGNPVTVESTLAALKPYIEKASASGIDSKRMLDLAFLLVRRNPDLGQCTRNSFGGSLMQCAKFGLYPDLRGHAWIIPRRTGPKTANGQKHYEAHFQLGYQGAIELARRSGEIAKIEARVVYDGDEFEYEYGDKPFVHHKPMRRRKVEQDRIIDAAYAVATLMNGQTQFEVLEPEDIERIMASARGLDKENSPWLKWPDMMQRKSAAVRLTKYLPASVDVQEAIALDEISTAGKSQGMLLSNEAQQALEGPAQDKPVPDSSISVDDLLGVDASGGDAIEAEFETSDPAEAF